MPKRVGVVLALVMTAKPFGFGAVVLLMLPVLPALAQQVPRKRN